MNNELSGAISPEIGGLTKLKGLYLGANQFTFQLSSTLPSKLSHLTELTKLLLAGGNQFTGTLPVELDNLYMLIDLCDLNGTITSSTNNAWRDHINDRGNWCTHYGSKINIWSMRCSDGTYSKLFENLIFMHLL
jgi:hypothetical protein